MTARFTKFKNSKQWLVRVSSPNFTPRETPGTIVTVNTKAGDTKPVVLIEMIWSGEDQYSGENVILASFVAIREGNSIKKDPENFVEAESFDEVSDSDEVPF